MNHALKQSQMLQEILEIPSVVERQIKDGLQAYVDAGQQAARTSPRGFVTCARGTSDHAAQYFKHLIETRTGLPVASMGPSVASIYETPLKLDGFGCLAISQSGKSPDLVALQRAARSGGAATIALLNQTQSPLADVSDTVLPILAGPEKSVAATKTFVGSLVAILGFVAGFTDDTGLLDALKTSPDAIAKALDSDWSTAAPMVTKASSIFTIGRGPSLAIASEAALKLKETCGIHAEAFSSAEVLHGPVALANKNLAALVFGPRDKTWASSETAAKAIEALGARVLRVSANVNASTTLSIPEAPHSDLVATLQIVAFYKFVEHLARRLGKDPDAPKGLNKVTSTL